MHINEKLLFLFSCIVLIYSQNFRKKLNNGMYESPYNLKIPQMATWVSLIKQKVIENVFFLQCKHLYLSKSL